MNAFGLDEGEPRLSEEDKMLCEGPITIGECYDAVKWMAKNKAPGVTGFTSEFYICFWDQFGELVEEYVQDVYARKSFFVTHARGILHLIPKKGDQTQLANKRPICLVDVPYKIVAKALAQRLGGCLDKKIHRDQTAFVKGTVPA